MPSRTVLGEQTILWAWPTPSHSGVWMLRGRSEPWSHIVPPITADPGTAAWSQALARYFAKALVASLNSPLYPSSFRLTPCRGLKGQGLTVYRGPKRDDGWSLYAYASASS